MRSTRKIIINNAQRGATWEEEVRRRCSKRWVGGEGGFAEQGDRGAAASAHQNPLKGSSLEYSSSPAVLLPL